MKLITNVGWCWTPRCEFCIVCTGRRLLLAQLAAVDNQDCGDCDDWTAQIIPMPQAEACLWQGELEFCDGRIEFGIGPDPLGSDFILLEGSIYETATSGPSVGDEVFVGDWRLLSATEDEVNCDFNDLLGAFVQSAYIDDNGFQQCVWTESTFHISVAPCEEEIV